MSYPGYNSGSVILSEGDWYPFSIHNLLQLQDGAWYYVLQDINGLKHFMPALHYEKYGLKTGDQILCKIDRINCTGRIFLEPKHPHYNEGDIYLFDVINYSQTGKVKIWIVEDIFGNYIDVPVYESINLDLTGHKKLRCFVRSIRKGIPILEFHTYIS